MKDHYAHRGTTYLARTFLYLAHANVHDLPLTPDAVRTPAVAVIVRKEQEVGDLLRKKIAETMGGAFQEPGLASNFAPRSGIPPLAAIVIDRAAPHRKNIPKVMVELRRDLKDFRDKIKWDENVMFWSRDKNEREAAINRWTKALAEIKNEFREWTENVRWEQGLDFATKVGELVGEPTKPKNWVQIAKAPIQELQRYFTRRTIV